jgi:hypothetical protein
VLGQPLQAQRQLVQPAAAALRPVQAHVPPPRHRLPRRHRPRAVPPRALRQARRRALRDEGEPVVGRRAHKINVFLGLYKINVRSIYQTLAIDVSTLKI